MSVTSEVAIDSLEELAARLPAPGTVDVTIEVIGEEIGDQIEVQKLPWHALVYDNSRRIVELSVGGRGHSVPVVLRHEIHDPKEVWVEEDGGSVRSISVEREDGPRTIVRFHERRALDAGN